METLYQDLRYGARQLVRSPGFAIVAIVTLALGIGANTAIFSVVNGVLLRPLPYEDPDRLAAVFHFYPSFGNLEATVAVPTYRDLREGEPRLESVAVQTWSGVNLTGDGRPERLTASLVSGEFFETYGVPAELGRTIRHDDVESGRNVVVLSHGLWQRLHGGDPAVLGRTMQLDGEAYEVVGVMPARFRDFFHDAAELWAPIAFDPAGSEARTSEFLSLTARLAPGVSMTEAERALEDFATRLKEAYPEAYPADWSLRLRPLDEQAKGDVRPALLVLLGAVGFVLMIAVANVANLLLARGTGRRRDIAVRTAMGAGRGRIARQLLTESLLLAIVGGLVGVVLAQWGTSALRALGPQDLPRVDEIAVDARVLLFALGVSALAGLLFGLLPALQAAGASPQTVLREEGRGSVRAFGHRGIRRAVVVAEVALAIVLMVGAGLMIRSFLQLQQVDPGFVAANGVTMQTTLPATEYGDAERRAAFFRAALPEIESVPGVESVGAVSTLPATGSGWTRSFAVEGYDPPAGSPDPWGEFRVATPGYFETLRIPTLRGRAFTAADDAAAAPVAIVDAVLAERYWPGEDPIGKRVGWGGADAVVWREVVGVVGHVTSGGVETSPRTQLYVPHAQLAIPHMSLVVRGAGDPTRLVPAIRDAVLRVDPNQPIYNVATVESLLSESVAQRQFIMLLLALFAALALVLAAVGIYGVMSYAVAQRAQEMGIRMALGAEAGKVIGMVLKQGLGTTLLGVALGVAGAAVLVRLIRSQLYAVSPSDPLTFVGAVALFTAVAVVATYLPARRAARADPVESLRAE